jgi:TonB family protein
MTQHSLPVQTLFLLILTLLTSCRTSEEAAQQYDVLPKLLEQTPPVYPERFLLGKEDAVVLLRLRLNDEGRVVGAAVVSTSGDSALDYAALEAVKRWKYSPAMREGKPVPIAIEQQVRFSLRPFEVISFYELVVTREELADSLWGLLDRGVDFGELAKKFSEAPSAAEGGLRQTVRFDVLPSAVRIVLERLSPGQLSSPFVRSDGKYVILKRKKA